jgi:hypothetical protein
MDALFSPRRSFPHLSFPQLKEEVIIITLPKATTGGGGGYGGGIITEGEVQWQYTRAGRKFIRRDDDDFMRLIIAIVKSGVLD